ncbi:hypothetical protein SAMN04488527_10880 [Aliiroseovarius crassostreae]|uniref:hypothetical protein n=1 Tax=Aliiroseovarius crassostreae TaxID=154981 RepID=UPI0008E56BC0|nr:hypothetical protein [Aliiroseovarius crassostreae]SFU62195.1 hypothetical protein SAMN04488527_10880 [Aliiroseovarius crassostreae]
MCDTSDKTTATPTVQIAPRLRVTERRFPHKGAQTGWHRHAYDYVVVPLFNGQLRIELPGGEEMILNCATAHPMHATSTPSIT